FQGIWRYAMGIDRKRKDTLMWSVYHGPADVVDRLLDAGVEISEITGSFFITVNGISICELDCAMVGLPLRNLGCEFYSLQKAIVRRRSIKRLFPGAVVAVRSGRCPKACSANEAA